MAFALGEGGEQNVPLGRAVIGGLTIATIATLFFSRSSSRCSASAPPCRRRPTFSLTSTSRWSASFGPITACCRTTCPSRVIYYYERTLTAQVGDIEHIESQSLAGYGVVKIFFQPDVNIANAVAQVTAVSQTVLKYLPRGTTPPYVLAYNASSVPILQIALLSNSLGPAF